MGELGVRLLVLGWHRVGRSGAGRFWCVVDNKLQRGFGVDGVGWEGGSGALAGRLVAENAATLLVTFVLCGQWSRFGLLWLVERPILKL